MSCVKGTEFDRASFDRLFDAHYAELDRFARRRVADQGSVDDVLAETFVTAWRRRTDIPKPALPWLYGVCALVIATARRTEARRGRLRGLLASVAVAPGRDPADIYAARSAIIAAFAQLSEDQREVLRLIAWEGLSTTDAATVLGCSPGAFRTRFHRARRELEKHLASGGNKEMQAGSRSAAR